MTWSIEDEARQAFELAQIYCGDCRDYHMTRAFLKAGGHQQGPERDREMFAPLLQRLSKPEARVLIAGAADTGILDFVLSAIGERAPRITVIDQCRTPLVLCERFGADRGVSITTVTGDLATAQLGPFDLIIGHVLMSFVPEDKQRDVLRRIAGMLAPEGNFVLALTNRPPEGSRRSPMSVATVLAGLDARGMALPGDGTAITEALRRHLERPRSTAGRGTAALQQLDAAGLVVRERHDTGTEVPGAADGPRPTRLYLVLQRAA